MVVHTLSLHRHQSRGDSSMDKIKDQKYDATYKFGKTTVHVISPGAISNDEKEKILNELHQAGWLIIDQLERSQNSKARLSG